MPGARSARIDLRAQRRFVALGRVDAAAERGVEPFGAGEDPRLPERVRFEERDDGGPVLRVNYSGLDYFRSFTP